LLEDFSRRRAYNAAADFVDANVERGFANKVAFTDADRSITYGELQAATFRFAAALRALDVRPEERVVLLLHDTVDYPVAFWGMIRAGVVAIPVNTFLNTEQYAYLLADSRAGFQRSDSHWHDARCKACRVVSPRGYFNRGLRRYTLS